ncbi:MAG: RecX family transcriptional regulator [Dehalococcoidia bacterium]|nr:RecX family transcriptional regulator [Dehalococcoidia bacterium]
MRVTAIRKQRREGRVNLYLDGRFALGLTLDAVAAAGLRIGDEIDDDTLRSLRRNAAGTDTVAAAMRLLSYRPRSESELRQRLARRGAPADLLDGAISRLRELGLVDDAAFARAWVEGRSRLSPRSQRLLRRELQAKGIDGEAAREALGPLDDEDAALRAAERRADAMRGLPYPEFRQRLGDFLRRRGFDTATVRRTVERLRQDGGGSQLKQ